ncbi:hypothetical protein O9X80_06290 [Agrobacterium salinitolerans]|uniref:hypothetical protein n=1 Tax=Agrobacterium salinitolerans TaxID=1183413 RepID=UPI0022B8108D|nr:hypothetical protein [Agrobacterium salinitolerans]MCZ7974101.1 hypothetical protein [Agrobacterium salinitolerans]
MVSESQTDTVNESFISRMSALFAELHTAGARHGEMPDSACDKLSEAAWLISDAIISAPVTCETDIAGKLRHAALLVECPHGEYTSEQPAIAAALNDLQRFRAEEWAEAVKVAKQRS